MRFRKMGTKKGRIEIIPMIDTILMLLIFYMTFGRLTKTESQLKIDLPSYVFTPFEYKENDIELVVDVKGKDKFIVGEKQYDMQALKKMLIDSKSVFSEVIVNIKGTGDAVVYQDIIDVLDTCAGAQVDKIGFVPVQ